MNSSLNKIALHKVSADAYDDRDAEIEHLRQIILHLTKASAIGTTAAMLVHELAQPVMSACNYLAGARRLLAGTSPRPHQEAAEAVNLAEECLTRAGGIMRNVKDAAVGKVFRPRPVKVMAVIDDVLRLYSAGWDLQPRITIAPAAAQVMGDRIQLTQVMLNLIRNATEATEGQARRSLALAVVMTDDDMVEIRVADNGPGIPAELKGTLFSPFSSTKEDGLGVGLSICRTIVEQHQGRIWAEALPLGTAFCFTLLPAYVSAIR